MKIWQLALLVLAIMVALAFAVPAYAGGGGPLVITTCSRDEIVAKIGGDWKDWGVFRFWISGDPTEHSFWSFERYKFREPALLTAPSNGRLEINLEWVPPGESRPAHAGMYTCPPGLTPTDPPPGWFFSPLP